MITFSEVASESHIEGKSLSLLAILHSSVHSNASQSLFQPTSSVLFEQILHYILAVTITSQLWYLVAQHSTPMESRFAKVKHFILKIFILVFIQKRILLRLLKGKTIRIVGHSFSARLTATLNLCQIYLKLFVHMLSQYGQCLCDFEVNHTKIKGGCQSGRKVVPHDSKSDLPLAVQQELSWILQSSQFFRQSTICLEN